MPTDPHPPAPRESAGEVIERRLRDGTLDPARFKIIRGSTGGVAIVGYPMPPVPADGQSVPGAPAADQTPRT